MRINYISVILLALPIIALGYMFWAGIDKQERAECLQWQAQALAIGQGWYATDWQIAQCEAQGIGLIKP